MNIKSLKISYLIITAFLMVVDSAYAMKRTLEEENQVLIELLPSDALNLILANLTLEDLSVSFVNKAWLNSAEHAFSDFYEFQRNYHKQTGNYKKENAFNILKELRKSYAQMKAKGRSDKEIQALAQAFLKRNFESIHKTTQTPVWLRETEFAKYPERWMQLALLRIWDTILLMEPLESYETPCLKMLAPVEELTENFNNETDFDTQCEFATELCERGAKHIATVANKAKLVPLASSQKAAKLFEIAISKDANALNENDYWFATRAHLENKNWKRAAELGEIAISKDPTKTDILIFWFAAKAHSGNKNWKRAAELGEITISIDPTTSIKAAFWFTAKAHFCNKNWKRAAELFEIAISKDANALNAFDYFVAAYAHFGNKNWKRATELFEIAISKDANALNGTDYLFVADAHYHNSNLKRAAELFEIALTKGFTIPADCIQNMYHRMAHAYEQLNDQQKAQEFRQKAIDAAPKQ